MKSRCLRLLIASAVLCGAAFAAERGALIRPTVLYVSPGATSAKLATAERGREAVILDRGNGWLHVIATLYDPNISPDPNAPPPERNITGWMLDKGLITDQTPNGDQILFGEAADSEDQASTRRGRKDAAADARRLYYRVYDIFPKSQLAGEALYRAADIQWQLDKADVETRPSSRTRDPQDRIPIDDSMMKMVQKKFPGTRWSDLAAFTVLDNKLCGDWAAASRCPEKEAEIYEKYGNDHANSPKAAEAYYNAAYRWAALTTIYQTEGQSKKIPDAQRRAADDAQKGLSKNSSPEWNARCQRLLYMVQKNIPVYGTAVE